MNVRQVMMLVAAPGCEGEYLMTKSAAFRIMPEGVNFPMCPIQLAYWLTCGKPRQLEDLGVCIRELGLTSAETDLIQAAADLRLHYSKLPGHFNLRKALLALVGRREDLPWNTNLQLTNHNPIRHPNDSQEALAEALAI